LSSWDVYPDDILIMAVPSLIVSTVQRTTKDPSLREATPPTDVLALAAPPEELSSRKLTDLGPIASISTTRSRTVIPTGSDTAISQKPSRHALVSEPFAAVAGAVVGEAGNDGLAT
jgi:hypothetical protein